MADTEHATDAVPWQPLEGLRGDETPAELDANTMTCALDESLVCTDKDDVVITLTERQE